MDAYESARTRDAKDTCKTNKSRRGSGGKAKRMGSGCGEKENEQLINIIWQDKLI